MDSTFNDLMFSHKNYKNKTKIIDTEVLQTNNGLYRIANKCSICKKI